MYKLLDKFLVFLETNKKLSLNTLESYKRDISQYLDYIKSIDIINIEKTSKKAIISYFDKLKDNGKSNATISRNMASLRSFYQYLLKNKIVNEDPTLNLETPKIEKSRPEILSIDEVALLLAQPNPVDLKGYRDKAMLELLYATGIRATELISLNIEDVDLEKGHINCISKSKERVIEVRSIAMKSLRDYIENSRENMIKDLSETALFINVNGKRLTRQGFWKIIKYYQEKANIDKAISPHMLRHSFAIHLVEEGTKPKELKKMLGHRDISSTNIYFNMVQDA